MANVTVDANAANGLEAGNRVSIRDSNDRVYVFVNAGGNIRAYKGNITGEPASFAEQDAGNAPDDADNVGIAAAQDVDGLIHVIYYFLDPAAMQAAPLVQYATFRTSAHPTTQDVWDIVDEEVAAIVNSQGDYSFTKLLAIALQLGTEPHAVWNDERADMGNQIENIQYANRRDGAWKAKVEVESVSEASGFFGLDFMIAPPNNSIGVDRPIVAMIEATGLSVNHGNAINATSFVQAPGVTTSQLETVNTNVGMVIDTDGDITICYVQNDGDLAVIQHLATQATWDSFETEVVVNSSNNHIYPDLAAIGTDLYIIVEDSDDNDLRMYKNTGTGWSEETGDADLPNVGTFSRPRIKWARYYNDSANFDFDDSTPIDNNNTWSNDAQAFDLNESTAATSSGNNLSNWLESNGTDAPGSGKTIKNVYVRVLALNVGPSGTLSVNVEVLDGGTVLLSTTALPPPSSLTKAWTRPLLVPAPSGGWTFAIIQGLEGRFSENSTPNNADLFRCQFTIELESEDLDYVFEEAGVSDVLYNTFVPTAPPAPTVKRYIKPKNVSLQI